MKIFIVICGIVIIGCLVAEKKSAARHRFAIKHVIHVNGTRGKSAVTRLIAAGLAECGIKTYCKTTGTLPMTIDTKGNETEIRRLGRANILEQIKILKKAYKDGAKVLVLECMAVDPELQYVCEHKILHSDIGIITNARVDHVAEMGDTIIEVTDALSNTIPDNGMVLTSDEIAIERISENAKKFNSMALLANEASFADGELSFLDFNNESFLFPENILLALKACELVGADIKTALLGMRKVKADPYEAQDYDINGVTFVNGMSANDPASTKMVYERFSHKKTKDGKLVIVLNTRPDRGYRTKLMIDYIIDQKPDEVWLLGSGKVVAARKLKNFVKVKTFNKASELPLGGAPKGSIIYAIGNIASEGFELIDRVKLEMIDRENSEMIDRVEEETKCTVK